VLICHSGDFEADLLAVLSLHIFTTEIVEGKNREKFMASQTRKPCCRKETVQCRS